jgi:hypothetical protein
MKRTPPPVPIAQPCSADWNPMTGDERRRLCAHCDKHVHNLSALNRTELHRFVEQRDGSECIAYVLREDGTMVSAPRWPRAAALLRRTRATVAWLLALILPSLFSGCAQRWSQTGSGLMKGTPLPGRPPSTAETRTIGR